MREPTCLMCTRGDDLHRLELDDGHAHLCADHARLLNGDPSDVTDMATLLERLGLERRRGADRRLGERRMFPRPEGRRLGLGRRTSDPQA